MTYGPEEVEAVIRVKLLNQGGHYSDRTGGDATVTDGILTESLATHQFKTF
ncbi:hypothetical protein ACFLXQ_04505 [Chloroflexota bacterium]